MDQQGKQIQEFSKLICKLDAATFLGVAKFVGVELFYKDVKDEQGHPMPRSGQSILEETLLRFNSLNRKERRQLISLVKKAARGK